MSITLTIIEIQMSILKIIEKKIRIFKNVLVAASCLRGYAKDETYFYKQNIIQKVYFPFSFSVFWLTNIQFSVAGVELITFSNKHNRKM